MIKPKEIILSRRRSIALTVNNQGELIVKAPFYVTDKMIMDFVRVKQDWIEKQINIPKFEQEHFKPVKMQEGDIVKYKGENFTIGLRGVDEITIFGDYILVPYNITKEDFTNWLKAKAASKITERAMYFAGLMHLVPQGVKLSSAKTRWGSCSYNNTLNFCWRLIMCREDVLDYVIVMN